MKASLARIVLLNAALLVGGCISIELPTERDAGACGVADTECCRLDAGIVLDASGLQANGCGAGLACVTGTGGRRVCRACPSGQRLCNGACVADADRSHCGACGNACAAGFDCVFAGGDAGGATSCERVCPPGLNRCGSGATSLCADLSSDAVNCGTCGTNCTARMLPNVSAVACAMGSCAVGTCAQNFANCDMRADNGCEVNTQSDVMHCGMCGRACVAPPNAVSVCRAGTCDFTCMAGFSDCDRDPANGCETNLNTDPQNCRACGTRCTAQPGQTATCANGTCGTSTTLMCPAGRGDCDANGANGCEENLFSGNAGMTAGTIDHCGACGTTCAFANAPAQCLAGACVIGNCVGTFRNCDGDQRNGCEVDVNTNSSHCGRCGGFCNFPNASAACTNGACALASCNEGFANCNNNAMDGCEIDARTSIQHCGRCGNACAAGEQCRLIGGIYRCELVCPAGQTNCSGRCADTRFDLQNCGACGRPCSPGQVCSNGTCAANCGAGLSNCSGTCRDLTSDSSNCGACGNPCAAGRVCANGACVLRCPSGQTACNNTFCANLTSDPANCGACGTSCTGRFANSGPTCASSACALGACNPGFGNCDGDAVNGCETNLNTSAAHCGACGNACSFANASATCVAGRCALGTCNSGFGNCDGIAENGCETNLNNSVNHCRTCGNACTTNAPGFVPACIAATCGTALGTCPAGRADCNGMSGDGCEATISSDLTNCGACGAFCARNNAAESCMSGVCVLGACSTGFGNCDGDAVNGCETNTNTSTTHCGGCGRLCFFANAAAVCTSGTCGLGTCATGFANCDGNSANGCEASLQSDRNNCNTCGNQCAAGQVCSAGVCTLMCQAGQTNCSGSCVNTATDRANCGTCGNACDAGRICQGGTCVLSCPAGQTACGGVCVNTQIDASNCGACGMTCGAGRTCSAGACVCAAGLSLCGGSCVDLQSSNTHCGMCNRACTGMTLCSAGSCVAACGSGTTNCSGTCVNTTNSATNCGACGNVCSFANATGVSCSASTCTFAGCAATHANCDNMSANGCEVNITNTASACGGCNNNCNTLPGVTSASCVSGLCASPVCMTGRGNCDGNASNGCETTLATDTTNCGACGNNCTNLDQVATASCSGSACSVLTCNPGFGNCDAMSANGCETNLNNSTTNCGTCGAVCPSGGANNTLSNACLSGRCNCPARYRDCDNSRANGCEIDRLSDTSNCGECGVLCSGATPVCLNGACRPSGCGTGGVACCPGNVCDANLACVSGNCTTACGGNGQPCCTNNICNGGLTCSGGTCRP